MLDKRKNFCYNKKALNFQSFERGVAQLVARDVWDVDAKGSDAVGGTTERS